VTPHELLQEALVIPPTDDERAVLATLRRRYGNTDRFASEAVAYLSGRKQFTADRHAAPPVPRREQSVQDRLEALYREDLAADPPTYEGQPPEPYWLLKGKSQHWYALVAGYLTEQTGEVVEVREPYPGEVEGCTFHDARLRAQAVRYAEQMVRGGWATGEQLHMAGAAAAAALRGEG
jgi:hypothetical protein